MDKKAPALRSVHQKKRPAKAAKAGYGHKREPVANAIATLTNAVAAEREADRTQQNRRERGREIREWVTLILLIITAGFVFGQWREMQRVYAPIAEQARFTRESYASIQRAFVSDARLEMVPKKDENGTLLYWEPRITVQNSGATPTRALEYVGIFRNPPNRASDPDGWFGEPATPGKLVKARLTIGPHSTVELLTPNRTVGRMPKKADDPTVWLEFSGVIMGAIKYSDVFDSTDSHITKFCFQILRNNVDEIFSYPCEHWNCSDEDCKANKEGYDFGYKFTPHHNKPPS